MSRARLLEARLHRRLAESRPTVEDDQAPLSEALAAARAALPAREP